MYVFGVLVYHIPNFITSAVCLLRVYILYRGTANNQLLLLKERDKQSPLDFKKCINFIGIYGRCNLTCIRLPTTIPFKRIPALTQLW